MDKFRILIADGLSSEGIEQLEKIDGVEVLNRKGITREELASELKTVNALIVRSRTKIDAECLEYAPQLKLAIRAGIGLDNVDIKAATQKGVVVMNAPTGNMVTTAEHAIAMMFSLTRNIPQATASMKAGKWEKSKFAGNELRGKNLGIIGLGNIGKIVAQCAVAFGMKVLGHDPYLSEEAAAKHSIRLLSLEDLLKQSDYVSLHVPFLESTKHLINADSLKLMKKGAYLINCARGGIVDEKALLQALDSGHLSGAALDVFEKEPPEEGYALLESDKIIVTPHLGASTDEAQTKVGLEVADEIAQYLEEGVFKNAVNVPSISVEELSLVKPYLTLCERLGGFLGQVSPKNVRKIHLHYSGEIAKQEKEVLTLSILKEFLSPNCAGAINFVNARGALKERGIQVEESNSEDSSDYTSLIKVTVSGETTLSASGTLFGKQEARIVGIDDFQIDAVPEGHLLFTRNSDLPGVIGTLGTLLGDRGVNISRMALGLDKRKEMAIALISVDSKVNEEAIDALRNAKGMISVQPVKL